MKLLTVVGARPQFVKAAMLSRRLAEDGRFREVLVHTGQHYDRDMSDVFFDELGLPEPDFHLGVGGGTHAEQTGAMLVGLERAMREARPDAVVVYGDTNSTLAGTLAAAKLGLPVAHVEAGLRSFRRTMPEEINRVVADRLAAQLHAPTEAARANLLREGAEPGRVHVVGDIMYDAALHFARRAERCGLVRELGLEPGGYVLATVHRAENTDDERSLRAILGGLLEVAREIPVVVPLHPRTRNAAAAAAGLLGEVERGLRLLPPQGYVAMTALERAARLVVTDSGGVQKEAFFHGVPCVTVRHETEWVELVECGWNVLAPPESAAGVAAAVRRALGTRPAVRPAPYGDGRTAERIAAALPLAAAA